MSSVETLSALERRLNAVVDQQAIRSQVTGKLKNIGRTAKIAGFRPGKVPTKVLEQHYGAQAHQEALGDALQASFAAAVETHALKVAGYPQFEVKTADLNAPEVEYSATFEVYPEIALGDLTAETLERSVFELSQEDIDNTVATLRKQRVTYEQADRAARAEDQVRIDFTGTLDGEVFQGGEAKDYPFVLGVGRMLPEFEAAITGMKSGETKSFDMTFPEDYHGKDVAGKQVTFSVTLNSVEAPKLPELDAEFAKSVGIEDGDVKKLESEIRSNLGREVARRLKGRNKEAAMDALLKVAAFDLPKALIDWEMQSLMQQTVQDMEARGMKMQGVSLPPELFRDRAERRVKLGLILADLADKHDMKAKPEQIRTLIEDLAESYDEPEQMVNWYYADPARLQEIENLVIEENLMAWVLGQCKAGEKSLTFQELMGN
ncbi:MAG: trigger factor [Gallionella sp.]|nr:trigger factor [Gallionella sp.]